MITSEQLREILTWQEDRHVDFKAEPHRLDNDHFISLFIKDILAMANTPRQDSAYIVIGVKAHTDGSKDLLGVSEHPDDSDLQSRLNKAKVTPKPDFVYQPIILDGNKYGVIEIPIQKLGPFFPTQDIGAIKAHRLYFRKGTQNEEASISEQANIYRWFHEDEDRQTRGQLQEITEPHLWDNLLTDCHHFDENRIFILILGPNSISDKHLWNYLGRLPISLVFDFDTETNSGGAYSESAPVLQSQRSVHLYTPDQTTAFVPTKSCYWFALRGLAMLPSSLVEDDWRKWNRKYGVQLQSLITEFAKSTEGRPITVISHWHAPEYTREVFSVLDRALGDAVEYILAFPESDRLQDLARQYNAKTVAIKLENVLYGIAQTIQNTSHQFSIAASLPRYDGTFHVLSNEILRWLAEDFEVLHSNVELEDTEQPQDEMDFLKGATISWIELSNHHDADRENTERFREQLEKELKLRTTTRFNLYHWPGAGGTTVARRIAWDLRRKYPTVLLRRIVHSETVGRFREIFNLTSHTILAVVEGADALSSAVEQLFNELKSENIPVVFLSVVRRFESPSNDEQKRGERVVFLGKSLTMPESYRFFESYKRFAPAKTEQLQALLHKPTKERTPFYFALTAFDHEFKGLHRYVSFRLQMATSAQREILVYIALAYYYGHRAILAQLFAVHLGYPENRPLKMENILTDQLRELLIEEQDQKWRPSHQLIGEEILKIVLSGNNEELRNWRRGLSTWAIDFIQVCSKSTLIPNYDILDLVRRVFILRDEKEILGTESSGNSQLSRFIEDIPNPEGQLVVLKEIVSNFPNEPHFWGHLGRFYSTVMGESNKAIEALQKAIDLSPYDPVLHHMKGMCYRNLAYDLIKKIPIQDTSKDGIIQLQDVVEKALESFDSARLYDALSEHAYISPVQLLLRILDFGYKISGSTSRTEFLTLSASKWYREKLDQAEDLLDRARANREGEKLSQFILNCQAGINEVYDNYSKALEGWNNLLSRDDVFAPPVRRQIVQAYLTRSKRDWIRLPKNEIERIVELMEENMREEPSSAHNIRIWFRAYRLSRRQDIDVAIDKIANWKALGDSIDAYYYLYVLHVLKAIDGSTIERIRSEDFIQQARVRARNQRNRTISYEWFGNGNALSRLRNYSELGEWNSETGFYANTSMLERIEGVVTHINRPESGTIELSSCGLTAFFVPAKAGFIKGRDENTRVSFYLGFSYEGLRAWSVISIR